MVSLSDIKQIEPAPEKGFFDKILGRQVEPKGLMGWLTTVDHKRIGILYGITALFWFLVGGTEALLIRIQLHRPEFRDFISADTYNKLFTMHGTTMIFLVLMPLAVAFFNYVMPLQIGARDVAFPRMNAFSYWMFLFGSILLNVSWFFGEAPHMAWTGYAPLTSTQYTPGIAGEFWVIGLQILGVSSVIGSLNFITTIINMRAPGMTFMRMPVFTWMTLVTAFMIILSFPAITICLAELLFDRLFGTNFFHAATGGMPILWQHLFWVFGHPEVYILILPAMGMVSEITPVFSRKPLFGYPLVVGSGVAIGIMGFSVWSHHMFTSGLGNIATAAFALTTMAISVPTGVKIFNWTGTLYKGQILLKTPMLFALGFIYQLMIGGFSGLMHANAVHDLQQHDTYFVVAHFHYVMVGGTLFATLGGLYYWFPMMTGKLLSEAKGKLVFWLFFAGFNITFFPMHWLGLNGMPRRIYTYKAHMGWDTINLVCTVGAVMMAIAVLIFVWDLLHSIKHGAPAGVDPWNARTIEWSLPTPTPVYNFKDLPQVKRLDDWWFTKYPEAVAHEAVDGMHPSDQQALEEIAHPHHDEHGVHLPGGSWFPMLSALAFTLAGFMVVMHRHFLPTGDIGKPVTTFATFISTYWPAIAFFLLGVGAVFAWAMEPIGGYTIHFKEEEKK